MRFKTIDYNSMSVINKIKLHKINNVDKFTDFNVGIGKVRVQLKSEYLTKMNFDLFVWNGDRADILIKNIDRSDRSGYKNKFIMSVVRNIPFGMKPSKMISDLKESLDFITDQTEVYFVAMGRNGGYEAILMTKTW